MSLEELESLLKGLRFTLIQNFEAGVPIYMRWTSDVEPEGLENRYMGGQVIISWGRPAHNALVLEMRTKKELEARLEDGVS